MADLKNKDLTNDKEVIDNKDSEKELIDPESIVMEFIDDMIEENFEEV